MTKKTTIKGTTEKLVAITEDRDLFGRLLIVANARQVNLREILCFELSAVPYSLVHTDGTLRKTTKSDLFQILEKDVTVEPRLSFLPNLQTVYNLDGMANAEICWSVKFRRHGSQLLRVLNILLPVGLQSTGCGL